MFSPTDGGDEPGQLSPGMQYPQRQSQRRFSMEVRVPLQASKGRHIHSRVVPIDPVTEGSNRNRLLWELRENICQVLEHSWPDSLTVLMTHAPVPIIGKMCLQNCIVRG